MDLQTLQMTEEERQEIVHYGIKRGKVILISTMLTIMMGGVLGIYWQSIIFWFTLSILRKYSGGYHADTEKKCYFISFVIVALSLLCIKFMNYDKEWAIILQTISLLVILFLVPIENKNHILDKEEKKEYGIRARIIAVLIYFLYVFLYLINKQHIIIPIGMAYIVVVFSLIFGNIKNHKKSWMAMAKKSSKVFASIFEKGGI